MPAGTYNEYSDAMIEFINLKIQNKELSSKQIAREFLNTFDSEFTYAAVDKKIQRLRKKQKTKRGIRRLFWDIETAPNLGFVWRTGYNLTISPSHIIKERAIICICWKWEHEDKVHHLTWDKNQCDREMLVEFSRELDKADEAIAHNGDRFDIKWFNTRCLFHGVPILPKRKTIDTLKKAKQYFYFNSNKLDYIAKFLEVGEKMDTGGFDLWKDILLDKSVEAMEKMIEYCKRDVIILEDVYHKIENYILKDSHAGVQSGGEKWQCNSCASSNIRLFKSTTTAQGTIQRWMSCNSCDNKYKLSNQVYLKYIEWRIKNK